MLGKTHAAAGAAAALYIVHPTTIEDAVLAAAGGIAGGLLCDIDSAKTAVHQKVILFLTAVVAILVAGTVMNKIHIDFDKISDVAVTIVSDPRIAWGAAFVIMCIAAAFTKHRSFSHSIVFAVAVYFLMSHAFRPLAAPLTAGVVTHIVLDLLNNNGVRLFWPLKTKLSCKLCSSSGIVNNLVFYVGIGASFLIAAESLGFFQLI